MTTSSTLPPLYDRWITELTGAPTHGEPAATCQDCAMLAPSPGLTSFHPDTKCCTYTPTIPNFLVGAALADARLDAIGGRDSLRARIAARAGVTPLGLGRDPVSSLIADHAGAAFGQAALLRCPHYDSPTGNCGVWLHRNAVCSTWFCKHERGAVGLSFWAALRNLLMEAEHDLARWCVLTLDAPHPSLPPRGAPKARQLSAAALDGGEADATYAQLWGAWSGREAELYARCDELVRDLCWADVQRICGPELGLQLRAFEQWRGRRSSSFVPAALVTRRLEVLDHGDPSVLSSYSGTDPLSVPAVLRQVLPVFRGQPTVDARAEIADVAGLELDDDLVVRLVDFGILNDVSDGK
jgi:Fe-S-cluster containining protein